MHIIGGGSGPCRKPADGRRSLAQQPQHQLPPDHHRPHCGQPPLCRHDRGGQLPPRPQPREPVVHQIVPLPLAPSQGDPPVLRDLPSDEHHDGEVLGGQAASQTAHGQPPPPLPLPPLCHLHPPPHRRRLPRQRAQILRVPADQGEHVLRSKGPCGLGAHRPEALLRLHLLLQPLDQVDPHWHPALPPHPGAQHQDLHDSCETQFPTEPQPKPWRERGSCDAAGDITNKQPATKAPPLIGRGERNIKQKIPVNSITSRLVRKSMHASGSTGPFFDDHYSHRFE